MKSLTKISRRLEELKTPVTSAQLATYLVISIHTTRKALRELIGMGEVRRKWIRGAWRYERKHTA